MSRILLDGMAIRPEGRGVARVLKQVLPLLASRKDGAEYVIVTTAHGREAMCGTAELVTAPTMPMTVWEQIGLPQYARRLGATAVYCHAECAPLWGPSVVLHVPEDPYARWAFSPIDTYKEHVRRAYQRATIRRSLLHSRFVITSSQAVACQLARRFGPALPRIEVVPLGVDSTIFSPDETQPKEDVVFHLGGETRDQSVLIVQAYAQALKLGASLPDLAIGGNLGSRASLVRDAASSLNLEKRIHLLGRLSDEELRSHYANAALCVQPALYEGFGLQPLEALACGAALVVFATPAVTEVVQDAALVVTQPSAHALAEQMAALWSDGATRKALRVKALHRASTYSWHTTADRLHVLLQTLAAPAQHYRPESKADRSPAHQHLDGSTSPTPASPRPESLLGTVESQLNNSVRQHSSQLLSPGPCGPPQMRLRP